MKRIGAIAVLLLAGCGSVDERKACGSSLECPAGEWCAAAEGERRCWPDATPPVVSAVTATCSPAPCVRDGVLHVEATATDDNEVLDASVTLDLAASQSVPMTRSGSRWVADVPLRQFPFGAFEDFDVVATVAARDGAKTSSAAASAAGVMVTRLRWTKEVEPGAGVALTPAAVDEHGTAVLAGGNGKLYFIASDGSARHAPITVAVGPISAAPAIGNTAIWVGGEDSQLRGVALDGSAALAGVGVALEASILGSVAVGMEASKEWAFAASRSGRLGAATAVAGEDNSTSASGSFTAGPVIDQSGRVFSATDVLDATMRCHDFDGAFTGDQCVVSQNPALGDRVLAPLSVDSVGNVWAGASDGSLSLTSRAGITSIVSTLSGAVTGTAIVLSTGEVIVGDETGLLHRLGPTGIPQWTAPVLGSAVSSPLVLRDGPAMLLVPTEGGEIYAINADGTVAWSATLGAGPALRAPNIYTPPGQTGPVMSTAYVPGADGKLYAIVVDGQLDTSAPWPKAFHDPRNTNNAGTQP